MQHLKGEIWQHSVAKNLARGMREAKRLYTRKLNTTLRVRKTHIIKGKGFRISPTTSLAGPTDPVDAITTTLHLPPSRLEGKNTYARILFTGISSALNPLLPQQVEKLTLLQVDNSTS